MRGILKGLPLIGFGVLFAGQVSAAVIDFEGPFFVTDPGETVTIDGFDFRTETTPGGGGAFGIQTEGPNGTASYFNANGAETVLSKNGGGTFSLSSFEFSRRTSDLAGNRSANSIDVIGTLVGGSTVTANTGVLGDDFAAFFLPGSFVGLTSVLFRPEQSLVTPSEFDYEFLLDKVTIDGGVSVVPLPAALPLLTAGIGLFGLLGWRRQKAV